MSQIMRVYLDNCCFNRPFDDQSQLRIRLETEAKTRIQEYILTKVIKLAWSYIMEYENSMNPFEERRNSIGEWKNHSETDVNEDNAITHRAAQLVNIGLRSKDSLHISCAVHADCDYFLTTDDKILNKSHLVEKIKITDPIDFIRKFER